MQFANTFSRQFLWKAIKSSEINFKEILQRESLKEWCLKQASKLNFNLEKSVQGNSSVLVSA